MRKPSFLSVIAYKLGVAQWVYYYKSQKLRSKLLARPASATDATADYLIAANDEACQNGGLCDILHGIVSSYYVAKQGNRSFRISAPFPFQLSDYLIPNQVDWRINPEEIDYSSVHIRNVPMMLGRFHATWAEEQAFHLKYLTQLAKQRGAILLYTNAHLVGGSEFSALFSELFMPADALQKQIDYHLSQIGDTYIGASFRFRNLLSDCYEPESLPLAPQEQSTLIRRSISQIEQLHLTVPSHKILVTSDSSKFCHALRSLPYVYCIDSPRGHVSFRGEDAVMSAFIDLYLLSKSAGNTLFLTDQLYHSGFAMTASFIGNIPYRELNYS